MEKSSVSPDSSSSAHYSNCKLCCRAGCTEPESSLSSNMKETSLGCVESINAHLLQTSQSHVLVAWMVSPANSENKLIIIALSRSGSSETRPEIFGSPTALKPSKHEVIVFTPGKLSKFSLKYHFFYMHIHL